MKTNDSIVNEKVWSLKKYKLISIIFNITFVVLTLVGLVLIALGVENPFFNGMSLNSITTIKYISILLIAGCWLLKATFFNVPISKVNKMIHGNDVILS